MCNINLLRKPFQTELTTLECLPMWCSLLVPVRALKSLSTFQSLTTNLWKEMRPSYCRLVPVLQEMSQPKPLDKTELLLSSVMMIVSFCSINILFIILIRGPIQFVSLFQYALLVWSLTPMRYKKAM